MAIDKILVELGVVRFVDAPNDVSVTLRVDDQLGAGQHTGLLFGHIRQGGHRLGGHIISVHLVRFPGQIVLGVVHRHPPAHGSTARAHRSFAAARQGWFPLEERFAGF